MLEKINEDDLLLAECLTYPISAVECIFGDLENLTQGETLANIRPYQYPMMSFEYIVDYDPTLSEKPSDCKKLNFERQECAGSVYSLGGRNYGKCFSENDYCNLYNGKKIKFKDLLNSKVQVVSFNEKTWKLEPKTAKFSDNGTRDCYKIVLESGKEITVTSEHPFYTPSGWVKAVDLNLNDYLATPRFYNVNSNKIVDCNLAKLLGYLLGDGGMTQRVDFTNINLDLIKEFSEVVEYFHCSLKKIKNKPTYIVQNSQNDKNKKNCNKIKQIVDLYKLDCLSKEKKIPQEVFTWDNKSIAVLINRLYACDGYINPNNTIEICLASKELIKDLQHLLLRFGIFSYIYYKESTYIDKNTGLKHSFDAWRLIISDYKNCKNFIDKIGIKSKDHKFKIKKLQFSNTDLIPNKFYYDIENSLKGYKKEFNTRKFKKYNVSREKWINLANIVNDKQISKIANSDIRWEKISSITFVPNIKTVSVEVEDNHTLVANDIISHNTHIVEVVDILLACIWLDDLEAGFTSSDAIHIKAILEEKLMPILARHEFYKMMAPQVNKSPNYKIAFKNGFTLIGINMNVASRAPGNNFYGKHLKRLYIEEASLETDEVYKKRIDARSEFGCITRSAGMTNFTRYMPAGKVFYDAKMRPWVSNLSQYANPNFDEKEREKALKKYGGENSTAFKVYVKGEIVEDGVSVMDMERIRRNYNENRIMKNFEITKENFGSFMSIIILDRPSGVDQVYVMADIGETAPTEIAIFFKTGNKYKYVYNITVYGLTDKEQPIIFKYVAESLKANYIGLDTTDGTGRSIFRTLNEIYPSENLVSVNFSEKIQVDFEKDDKGNIKVDQEGKPIYKEEYVSEWSIKRLKDLLYENLIDLPLDYKLDSQLNSVVATISGSRVVYNVVGEEDHLLAAFRVFSIAQWFNEFNLNNPITMSNFCKSGC